MALIRSCFNNAVDAFRPARPYRVSLTVPGNNYVDIIAFGRGTYLYVALGGIPVRISPLSPRCSTHSDCLRA